MLLHQLLVWLPGHRPGYELEINIFGQKWMQLPHRLLRALIVCDRTKISVQGHTYFSTVFLKSNFTKQSSWIPFRFLVIGGLIKINHSWHERCIRLSSTLQCSSCQGNRGNWSSHLSCLHKCKWTDNNLNISTDYIHLKHNLNCLAKTHLPHIDRDLLVVVWMSEKAQYVVGRVGIHQPPYNNRQPVFY